MANLRYHWMSVLILVLLTVSGCSTNPELVARVPTPPVVQGYSATNSSDWSVFYRETTVFLSRAGDVLGVINDFLPDQLSSRLGPIARWSRFAPHLKTVAVTAKTLGCLVDSNVVNATLYMRQNNHLHMGMVLIGSSTNLGSPRFIFCLAGLKAMATAGPGEAQSGGNEEEDDSSSWGKQPSLLACSIPYSLKTTAGTTYGVAIFGIGSQQVCQDLCRQTAGCHPGREDTPAANAAVNTNRLNMRTGPGTEYRVIRSYDYGTSVAILDGQSNSPWVRVQVINDGAQGWMHSRYLRHQQNAEPHHESITAPLPVATEDSHQSDPSRLAIELGEAVLSSPVHNAFPWQAELFAVNLAQRSEEFHLLHVGISADSMTAALSRRGSGDRINVLIHRIWDDWSQYGLDHMHEDPGLHGQAPFRQAVIRIIQNRPAELSVQDQQALFRYFTVYNDVVAGNIRGVIAEINREVYGW